jgi:Tol biopolymer transport system component/DNA-binding winged helix-turn-helix (wHTH) protein
VLTRGGEPCALAPKSFDLLVLLAASEGRLLTRRALMKALWGDAFVEEGNLTFQIAALRKVFGDEGRDWIETAPKHGYRFVAPVVRFGSPSAVEAPAAPSPARTRRRLLPWVAAGGALALASAGVVLFPRARFNSPVRPPDPVQLTSYFGFEQGADLSPDGSQVVFSWDGPSEGNLDLYVKLAGTGDPLRLTDDPADDLTPAWSPDGLWIAFLRTRPDERAGLYVKPALGGAERLVRTMHSPFWRNLVNERNLAWTPDGSGLLMGGSVDPGGVYGIWWISASTGEARRLTALPVGMSSDAGPSAAPDGSAVAFLRFAAEGDGDVYRLPLKNGVPAGELRRLTSERSSLSAPTWTPDGRAILYSAGYHLSHRSLRRLSLDGDFLSARPGERLPFAEGARGVALSRTGRLVYSRSTRDSNIWRVPVSGGAAPVRWIASTADDHTPAYSPDGRRIAFASTRSGTEEIWIASADGSNPVQLTSLGAAANPQFSPDGRSLIFHVHKRGTDIYSLDLASGAVKLLNGDSSADVQPHWSRDGRSIYFSSNRTGQFNLWKMQADGGSPTPVVQGQRVLLGMESPDGSTLFFADHNSLWSRPLQGGGEPTLIAGDLTYSLNFVLADTGIYFLGKGAGPRQTRLRFFDYRTRRTTTLREIDKAWWFGMALHPDGESILLSVRDQDGLDLWLIDGVR